MKLTTLESSRRQGVLGFSWGLSACLALLLVAGAGCGGGAEGGGKQLPTFRVKGVITYNTKPVEGATVSFHPAKEGAPGAVAKTNSAGAYQLRTYSAGDGAPEGEYQVTVQKAELPPAENKSGAEMFKQMEIDAKAGKTAVAESSLSLIPEKYARSQSSGLGAAVKSSGTNEFNFELKD